MSLQRSVAVQRIRQQADAVSAEKNWTPDFVLLLAERVYDNEWSEILKTVPYYRYAVRTVTPVLSGGVARVAKADLESGSGATMERLFRVLQIGTAAGELTYTKPAAVPLWQTTAVPTAGVYPPVRWWTRAGDYLLVPGDLAGQALTVVVSHKPPLATTLTDTDTLTFPDGYDLVPLFETAAQMLTRGGNELAIAETMMQAVERQRALLLDDLGRDDSGPRFLEASDDGADWGGTW